MIRNICYTFYITLGLLLAGCGSDSASTPNSCGALGLAAKPAGSATVDSGINGRIANGTECTDLNKSPVVALIVGLIYHNRVSHLREIAETKTAFSRQLIESQEAERKRIAAELHDGLGQNLVVIKNRAMLGIKKGDDKERAAKDQECADDGQDDTHQRCPTGT